MNETLKRGYVVQLDPTNVTNKALAGCLMVVLNQTTEGAYGYIQVPNLDGLASETKLVYYHAALREMIPVGIVRFICDQLQA